MATMPSTASSTAASATRLIRSTATRAMRGQSIVLRLVERGVTEGFGAFGGRGWMSICCMVSVKVICVS